MMLRLVPAFLLSLILAGSVVVQQSNAADARTGGAPRAGADAHPAAGTGFATGFAPGFSLETPGPGTGEGIEPILDPRLRMTREAYPKVPTEDLRLPVNRATGEPSYTGRIILKLRDDLGARALRQVATDRVYSTIGRDLNAFDLLLARFNGTVQQWITHRDDLALREVELRAEVKSGRGQPDLASFMVVNVPSHQLLAAGRAFNDLDIVEFVEFEMPLANFQQETCNVLNDVICNAPAVPFCTDLDFYLCNPDPGCDLEACRSGCADVACCELVTATLPYCSDPDLPQGWDLVCAAVANAVCAQTIYDNFGALPFEERYDPCFTDGTGQPNPIFAEFTGILTGGCFDARENRGCNRPECCFAVCSIDPTCCSQSWDGSCVSLAASELLLPACRMDLDEGPTPSFASTDIPNPNYPLAGEPPFLASNWQTYTSRWPATGDSIPAILHPDAPFPATGFRGGGYDLAGLRTLQQQFAHLYQGGIEPNLNGRTVKLGVVEFAAFVNHEDFTIGADGQPLAQPRVIPEPNQTIILLGDNPDHGTACLGVTVAADNGFGVTGIAHEAQGYFFPTLSVEEGSRLPNAILSATQLFDDGDVLNFSIGYPGIGPIITSTPVAALIALCSDLGITCVMSAGNDAIPIQPAPFETGAIVVGACFPGGNVPVMGCQALGVFHYCRMGFSNFTTEGSADLLETVHVSAWGTAVATTGYGDLFRGATSGTDPIDPETNNLRTYTAYFNGTSAAGPVVAGLVACLQAMAKQLYSSPISPLQMRGVLMTNSVGLQCWPISIITRAPGPDDPECILNNEWRDIGEFPDALACGFAIMNGQFVSGNPTRMRIMYGTAANSISAFRIRSWDGNYQKVNSQHADAGLKVQGLTYLATGPTTDIYAYIHTLLNPAEIQSIALVVAAQATKPFVLLGGFAWNHVDRRWDMLGANIIGLGPGLVGFNVPSVMLNKYIRADGTVEARVWTCGLGFVGPHQVWYDLISLGVNEPFIPVE